MGSEKRKSWSVPKETKEQILKLRKESEMTCWDIAKYLGLELTTVNNIVYRESRYRSSKVYYEKNREKILKKMAEYYLRNPDSKKKHDHRKDNRPDDTGGIPSV